MLHMFKLISAQPCWSPLPEPRQAAALVTVMQVPEVVDPSHSIQAIWWSWKTTWCLLKLFTIHWQGHCPAGLMKGIWVSDNSTHKMFYIRWAKTKKNDLIFSWLGNLEKKWQISQWWSCSVKPPWILEAVCCSLPSYGAETDFKLLWKFGVGHLLIIASEQFCLKRLAIIFPWILKILKEQQPTEGFQPW